MRQKLGVARGMVAMGHWSSSFRERKCELAVRHFNLNPLAFLKAGLLKPLTTQAKHWNSVVRCEAVRHGCCSHN